MGFEDLGLKTEEQPKFFSRGPRHRKIGGWTAKWLSKGSLIEMRDGNWERREKKAGRRLRELTPTE